MSPSSRHRKADQLPVQRRACASVFAALGDETRLALVGELAGGKPRSITQLTEGAKISRQAISKHLRVLQDSGVVRSVKSGRETLFEYEPKAVGEAREYLDLISKQWD